MFCFMIPFFLGEYFSFLKPYEKILMFWEGMEYYSLNIFINKKGKI